MPTLREVRSRIIGVKKTQKITRAMKMVAAAKLRRAQVAVVSARPYAATMRTLLGHLALYAGPEADAALIARPVGTVALVVVTADRGLCGAFNTNIIKLTQAHVNGEYADHLKQGKLKLVTIGRKGSDFFRKGGFSIACGYPGAFQRLTFSSVQQITRVLVDMYRSGEVDRIDLVYNEFKNASQQKPVVEQFLPISPDAVSGQTSRHSINYIYEPDMLSILSALIPRYLDFRLWRAMLESAAAEEGARMTAMENATENANEMISTLQLKYNNARQASITKELLEIVSGAEAQTQ